MKEYKIEILISIIAMIGILHLTILLRALGFYNNVNFLVIACFFSTSLSVIFGMFGLFAIIKVISLEKSTHEIEYVPISEKDIKEHENTDWKKLEEEMMKSVEKEENDYLSFKN